MDQERPIERLLRDAARARSEHAGPPPELHPANRRILHNEIKRCHPPTPVRTPWWQVFAANPLARLGWAAAIIFLVGLAFWIAVPSRHAVKEIALNTPTPGNQAAKGATSPPITGQKLDSLNFDESKDKIAERGARLLLPDPADSTRLKPADAIQTGDNTEGMNLQEKLYAAGSYAAGRPGASGAVTEYYSNSTATMDSTAETPLVASRTKRQDDLSPDATLAPASAALPAAPADPKAATLERHEYYGRFAGSLRITSSAESASVPLAKIGASPLSYSHDSPEKPENSLPPEVELQTKWYGLPLQPARTESQPLATPSFGGARVYGHVGQATHPAAKSTLGVRASKLESNFRQTSRRAPVAVLENFKLQQVGNLVTVHDQDGSRYIGYVVADSIPSKDVVQFHRESQRDLRARMTPEAAPGQTAFGDTLGAAFQVSGTNLTLNQFVNFSGQLTTNRAQSSAEISATNAMAGAAKDNIQRQIVGEVSIEGQPAFKMEALEFK